MSTPSPKPIQYTYQDYLLLPEDSNRYEIIDGDLYVTPSPVPRHQRLVVRLTHLLEAFTTQHQIGVVISGPCDVILSDTDVLVPDLLFVRSARSGIITEKNVQGPPDLVIEVLSPSTASRDRQLKLKTYAKFGVPEYWIVDPEGRSIEVHRLTPAGASLLGRYSGTVSLSSPTLPGLSLPLSDIFETG